MSSTEKIRIAGKLDLDAPGGESVPVREVYMEITQSGDQLVSVVIEFQVDYATWERIDAGGWFNMAPETRGDTFAGKLDPEKVVEIEARLGDASLPLLAIVSENIWELGGTLYPDGGPDEMRNTESWYGMYVKQEYLPGLKTGFQTKWSALGGPDAGA